ncbi:MAG: hypothetical protein KJ574_03400 [Nanoarchaeota archaeon]|nr:hypothetical protein [Nanoarchaeota archaeon]
MPLISFYEIELKALLLREQYDRLGSELPKRLRLVNEDTIHTTRYRPGDIRLRHSPKTLEMVMKEGDPTKICRRERIMRFKTMEAFEGMAAHFRDNPDYKADPPWMKYKREFECSFQGYTYVICLQDIKDFAYVLEVEHLSEVDDSQIHEPNLRAIIQRLGCEPIDPADFTRRIDEYIQSNRRA